MKESNGKVLGQSKEISKKLILIISLLLANHHWVVGQSLEDRLAEISCQCLDSINISEAFDLPIECIKNTSFKDEQIINHFDSLSKVPFGDSYQTGYDWGLKHMPQVFAQMIFSCDRFYHLIESLRNAGFQNMDTVGVIDDLRRADSLINSGGSQIEGYFTKATNFMFWGKLDSALINANQVLELYSEFAGGFFLRGQIHEKMGQYHLAKSDYETCIKLPNSPVTTILLIKIAERKIRESE